MPERLHRVLVVGVGSIGERHLRCFLGTRRAEVAFVEPNAALRDRVAGSYPVSAAESSLDAGIEWRPEIAVICTPAPLHIPQAVQLAERNIHLLIEKPLSTSLSDVGRLQELVEGRRLTAGVAYVYRAHPALAAMRDAIQSGRFGRPVQLVAVCGQNFPTYRPAYREIYYRDRALGGGAIQDALTHIINAAEWLVGPIDKLVADAGHQVLDGVDVEDTVHVLARHGDVMASYSLNQHQAPNETTLSVICERGTVRFEVHNRRWMWMESPDSAWTDETQPAMERDTLFIVQANAFLDAVEGTRSVLCPLSEGAQTLKVNLAALASLDGTGWKSIARR